MNSGPFLLNECPFKQEKAKQWGHSCAKDHSNAQFRDFFIFSEQVIVPCRCDFPAENLMI